MVLYLTCGSFADRKFKMAAMRKLTLTLDPMGISFQKPILDYYYVEKQADNYQAMC